MTGEKRSVANFNRYIKEHQAEHVARVKEVLKELLEEDTAGYNHTDLANYNATLLACSEALSIELRVQRAETQRMPEKT